MRSMGLALALLLSSCVSSGVVRTPPPAAAARVASLVGDDVLLAVWDGSFSQDGSRVVVLTDAAVTLHDDGSTHRLGLDGIDSIAVDQDAGGVVVRAGKTVLVLPIDTDDRLAFADLLRRAVQDRKLAGAAPTSTAP